MRLNSHGEAGYRDHKGTPEWNSWHSMHQRCRDKKCPQYPNYGGRGVRVCHRWFAYENFLADMGRKPDPSYSLDRIDVNDGYKPGNCRWASKKTQQRNRRCSKLTDRQVRQINLLVDIGYQQTFVARAYGVSKQTVCDIRKGRLWLEDKAIGQ